MIKIPKKKKKVSQPATLDTKKLEAVTGAGSDVVALRIGLNHNSTMISA